MRPGTDYIVEREPAGTGDALLLARPRLDDTFLVVNGDTLFDLNYLDLELLLEGSGAAAVAALRYLPDTGRYGRVCLDGYLVTGFAEKAGGGPGAVNDGVYAMRKEALAGLQGVPSSLEKDLFPLLAGSAWVLPPLCSCRCPTW